MTPTPLPWRQDGTHVIGPDNVVVAVCRQAKPRCTNDAIANARLIAAAPDLLAACEAMTEHLSTTFPPYGTGQSPYDKIRAAIAKAKGSHP